MLRGCTDNFSAHCILWPDLASSHDANERRQWFLCKRSNSYRVNPANIPEAKTFGQFLLTKYMREIGEQKQNYNQKKEDKTN